MKTSEKKRWAFLSAAVLLLVAGAWLMRGAQPPPRVPPPAVRLPRQETQTAAEQARNVSRRTWVPLVSPVSGDGGEGAVAREALGRRDPVMAIMPKQVRRGAVVAEFNAMVNSDVGGLLLQCLSESEHSPLARLRDAGLDPASGIDRVALWDDTFVVTGAFSDAAVRALLPGHVTVRSYGRKGQLYEWQGSNGETRIAALWDNQMLVWGKDEGSTKGVVDRLEAPPSDERVERKERGVLSEADAWGDVYGVLTGEGMAAALGEASGELGQTVQEAAKSFRVHVDMSHDVGLVGEVEANDPQKAEELRRALGSALSLARMKAQAEGKGDEADVLDMAKVKSAKGTSSFSLEAGLPYGLLEMGLRRCVEMQREKGADAGAPPQGT